jgi:hypothetical protein
MKTMTTFTFGNGDNLTVSVLTNNDTYIIGNGTGDTVNANDADFIYDAIIVGNGNGDTVNANDSVGDTIIVGNGNGDSVTAIDSFLDQITLGNGNGDSVVVLSSGDTVTLGNGNGDIVNDSHGVGNTITVGNGNDTIYVGINDTVTVGKGQDTFIFDATRAGNIGADTINGFRPERVHGSQPDVIQLKSALWGSGPMPTITTDADGNAVLSDGQGDTITLVGVHASALHASNFHFL